MPGCGDGSRSGANAAWGDHADEAGEINPDHQVSRGGVRHESVLLMAESSRGREVLEVPRALHGGAVCVPARQQDRHDCDQQEELAHTDGCGPILF
jgi:hypothetical protein